MGPRFLVRAAGLEMHPIDQADRREYLKDSGGIGYCNITKCCTEVCPEHIKITDNAIIPLKERVADAYYDPLQWAWRKLRGGGRSRAEPRRAAGRSRGTPPARPTRPAGVTDADVPGAGDAADDRADRADAPSAAAASAAGFVIRTDGAARGNPGPASAGAALYDLRAARRARPAGRAGRVDLGLPRASRPTTSPSTPASSGRSSWPASSARRRSTCCSTPSSSSSS